MLRPVGYACREPISLQWLAQGVRRAKTPHKTQLYKWYNALMKALTKASRLNTALQVIQRMNDGMSVIEACRMTQKSRHSLAYSQLALWNEVKALARASLPHYALHISSSESRRGILDSLDRVSYICKFYT